MRRPSKMKTYKFEYDMGEAFADFEVDLEKFTPEIAKKNLELFFRNYDKNANPIDEVLKKYAIEVIKECTFTNYNTLGVICAFESKEGFVKIDGSSGIKLTYCEGYEVCDSKLCLNTI